MKKGLSSDLTAIFILVAVILIVATISYILLTSGIDQIQTFSRSYDAIKSDMALQGVIEGFEKTALFFGMMNTAKELGAHGGVSEAVVKSAGALEPIMSVESGVPYLAPVSCECSDGMGAESCGEKTVVGDNVLGYIYYYEDGVVRHYAKYKNDPKPDANQRDCDPPSVACLTSEAGCKQTALDACQNYFPGSNYADAYFSSESSAMLCNYWMGGTAWRCLTRAGGNEDEINSGCKINKRMPFVQNKDMNAKIGTTAVTFPLISAADGEEKKYSENLEDVKNGLYKFNAIFEVFMLKPDTLTVQVYQGDNCVTSGSGTNCKEIPISETGIMPMEISKDIVKADNLDVTFSIYGTKADAAVLRQVAVSIYNKGVVESANKLLETNMNGSQEKLKTFEQNAITIKTNPFEAAFMPAGKGAYGALDETQGFMKGVARIPKGISAKSDDVSVASEGIAEEDVKIRYFKMYRFAEYFVDNLDQEGFIKSRLLEKTEIMDDYCSNSAVVCPGSDCPVNDCTEPRASTYSGDYFRSLLNQGLQSLADQMNTAYSSEGFSWKITIPDTLLTSSDFSSAVKSSTSTSSGAWHCLIYGEFGCINGHYDINCFTQYARKYTSNGHPLKIQAEITDEKYKTFDSASKTWTHPTFKFYVEYLPFEDDYCDGLRCSTFGDYGTLPPVVAPAVPEPDIFDYTCAKTTGQTCEEGTGCPAGKVSGSGTCRFGSVCCKPFIMPVPEPLSCALTDPSPFNECPTGTVHCGIDEGCLENNPPQLCCMPK